MLYQDLAKLLGQENLTCSSFVLQIDSLNYIWIAQSLLKFIKSQYPLEEERVDKNTFLGVVLAL